MIKAPRGHTSVYFSDYLKANIAIVHAYTRGLSDSEVLQNYNTLKGRFI